LGLRRLLLRLGGFLAHRLKALGLAGQLGLLLGCLLGFCRLLLLRCLLRHLLLLPGDLGGLGRLVAAGELVGEILERVSGLTLRLSALLGLRRLLGLVERFVGLLLFLLGLVAAAHLFRLLGDALLGLLLLRR